MILNTKLTSALMKRLTEALGWKPEVQDYAALLLTSLVPQTRSVYKKRELYSI